MLENRLQHLVQRTLSAMGRHGGERTPEAALSVSSNSAGQSRPAGQSAGKSASPGSDCPDLPLEPLAGAEALLLDAERLARIQPYFAYLASGARSRPPKGVCAFWVSAGTELAAVSPAATAPAGGPRRPQCVPGSGVELSPDGTRLLASAAGYLCLQAGVLSISCPLQLSADKLAASFLYLPCLPCSAPDEAEIQALLSTAGVIRGHLEGAATRVVRRFATESTVPARLLLARGTAAVPGQDGQICFAVECRKQASRTTADGRIDLRDLGCGVDVPAGIVLARVRPSIPGAPGFTVLGEDLPAVDGEPAVLEAGRHVEMREEDGERVFRAQTDGRVSLQGHTLHVDEVLEIPGDVDYSVGHIDFHGEVLIHGSVLSGFRVKSGGSVRIDGHLEPGATVDSGADVVVGGGIIGDTTRVLAAGDVVARFVQEATIRAGGDLQLASHAYGANLRVQGQVGLETTCGRRSGTIAGGQVVAGRGIRARFAGSPSGTSTRLIVGVDPQVEESLAHCTECLDECARRRAQVERLLGLRDVDGQHLRRLLAHTPHAARQRVAGLIRHWQKLQKADKALRARARELRHRLDVATAHAALEIAETIYPGVSLQVGEHRADIHLELRDTHLTSQTWTQQLMLEDAA